MSAIPFFVRRGRAADPRPVEASVVEETTPSAAAGTRRLVLDIVRYVSLTVVGPAAAVLAVAAALSD